jgi:hypothetical protein
MFVRWQLYRSQALNRHQRKRNDASARLNAVLVENKRIDGQSRQRHIALLGSTTIDAKGHRWFWCRVMERLDQLDNRLTPQDRARVVAAIAKRLDEKPPTKAQIEKSRRDRAASLKGRGR